MTHKRNFRRAVDRLIFAQDLINVAFLCILVEQMAHSVAFLGRSCFRHCRRRRWAYFPERHWFGKVAAECAHRGHVWSLSMCRANHMNRIRSADRCNCGRSTVGTLFLAVLQRQQRSAGRLVLLLAQGRFLDIAPGANVDQKFNSASGCPAARSTMGSVGTMMRPAARCSMACRYSVRPASVTGIPIRFMVFRSICWMCGAVSTTACTFLESRPNRVGDFLS